MTKAKLLFIVIMLFLLPIKAIAQKGIENYSIGSTSVNFADPNRNNRSVTAEVFYPLSGTSLTNPEGFSNSASFPVIAFGHGYLMNWNDYDYFWLNLVPEGYIVVLPKTETNLFPSHLDLGLDMAFLIKKINEENSNPASVFYGIVSNKSAVTGHSMGGGAAFLAAQSDNSIDALSALAPAETNPSAVSAASSIQIPALIFGGSSDCVTPPESNQIPMYEALNSDCRTFINITGASHCQFAEYNLTCNLGEGSCQPPSITRSQQHGHVINFLLPWLNYFLKNDITSGLQFADLLFSSQSIVFLHECDDPVVPVELIHFGASLVPGGVLLRWVTASEINCFGFEIERQNRDEIFENIGFIKSGGGSSEITDYSFIDDPGNGLFRYRLKQLDIDGQFSYSEIIEIDNDKLPSEFKLLQNYPNPFNPATIIKYQVPIKSRIKIVIYDLLGNEAALAVDEEKEPGSYEVDFDASRLSSGVYIYALESKNIKIARKMILIR